MTEQAMPKVVVVVPTYNERESLPILIDTLQSLDMPNLHVLVVDDNSPDGTGDVADKLALDSAGRIGVLHRTAKDGLGRAYVAGITRALHEGADIVVQMDADLSHPASVIPTMVDTLQSTDASVVVGSRYVTGGSTAADWPWHRKALSVWANLYVNAILRLHVKDATAGFKAWRASTLAVIDVASVRSNGYSFQVEMNYRALKHRQKIVEVPIRFKERVEGASKMTLRVQLESALTPWKLILRKH
ncbi:MAG TPA: polyprenol monophosphomannose synthase [Jatrophihabitans sp.]